MIIVRKPKSLGFAAALITIWIASSVVSVIAIISIVRNFV